MWLLGPFIIINWGLEIGFGIWGKIRIEAASSRSVCKSMKKERPCQHSYIHFGPIFGGRGSRNCRRRQQKQSSD